MANNRKQPQTTNTANQSPPSSNMVIMGHIIGAFGVRGWIKVAPYTETIDGLLNYPVWWLGKKNTTWQKTTLTGGHVNGNTLTAKLAQCIDRTQALQLKGWQIAIPRNQLPHLSENGEDGYYWSDLIGATVTNLQGEKLGEVTGLLTTGANDVLRVQKSSEKERLIPFIDSVIVNVDLKFQRITVDWGIDY